MNKEFPWPRASGAIAALLAAAATGRLRVYAVVVDVSAAMTEAAVAQRDLI